MKIKTSELQGPALNWAVATVEGYKYVTFQQLGRMQVFVSNKKHECYDFDPTENWAQGGPIIERERIELKDDGGTDWLASHNNDTVQFGPTPLIAAMRCFCASRLGDEVELPEELK